MTGDDVTKILARAIADADFLTRLLADPATAARDVGVSLGAEDAATLREMTADEFRTFAAQYASSTDPAKRRAAC
jgi:hypothetical protein